MSMCSVSVCLPTKPLCVNVQERQHGQRLNIIVLAEGAVDLDGNVITAESVREVIHSLLSSLGRLSLAILPEADISMSKDTNSDKATETKLMPFCKGS